MEIICKILKKCKPAQMDCQAGERTALLSGKAHAGSCISIGFQRVYFVQSPLEFQHFHFDIPRQLL
jgi:hypothetical protein